MYQQFELSKETLDRIQQKVNDLQNVLITDEVIEEAFLNKKTVYDKINFTDVEYFNDIEFKHVKDALPRGAQIVGWCRDDNNNDCEEALRKTVKEHSTVVRGL